jgi:hypothetical protein
VASCWPNQSVVSTPELPDLILGLEASWVFSTFSRKSWYCACLFPHRLSWPPYHRCWTDLRILDCSANWNSKKLRATNTVVSMATGDSWTWCPTPRECTGCRSGCGGLATGVPPYINDTSPRHSTHHKSPKVTIHTARWQRLGLYSDWTDRFGSLNFTPIGTGIKRLEHTAHHSPLCRNVWSHVYTCPYVFGARCLIKWKTSHGASSGKERLFCSLLIY